MVRFPLSLIWMEFQGRRLDQGLHRPDRRDAGPDWHAELVRGADSGDG